MVQALLEFLAAQGSLVAPEAAAYLAEPGCPKDRIEAALRNLKELPFILTRADLERLAAEAVKEAPRPAAPVQAEKTVAAAPETVQAPLDPRPQYG
ncbi:MAG TPA: hypothetical protein VNZ52_15360, partial [Candidatus Thermoplasmatota archaeon]|nr:hypothetical protein [Candidatus Thermoplasmatota archaeon]